MTSFILRRSMRCIPLVQMKAEEPCKDEMYHPIAHTAYTELTYQRYIKRKITPNKNQ